MDIKVFIVIVVYKRLELTKACLASLLRQNYQNYKIVLVDHCEQDETTAQYIRQNMPEVDVVKGTDDMWWTAATNFGIKHVLENLSPNLDQDLILTLNNDLTVPAEYIQELVNTYQASDHKTLVGSVSLDGDEPELIDFAGCIWNKVSTRIRSSFSANTKYSQIRELGSVNSDLLPGRGTLFPISLINEIGYYDQEQFPHYASDYDFSYRAKLKGYRLIVSTKAYLKSAVGETGVRFDKNASAAPTLSYFWKTQTSIKSPINIKTRYNWAKKHARIPLIYFSIDSMRVVFSYLTYLRKYYKKAA
jgi:GT2 family glycosyltransferase